MLDLIAASAYFLLIHFGVSGTRLRDALIARIGSGPYRGAFALASLLGLAWMVYAFRHTPDVPLWGLVLGLRPAVDVLVLIAFLFAVVGVATPSPTRVGMESQLRHGPDIARGIVRITRHPFLWGVALWALVHLIVNGDLAALILFGSLFVLGLGGTVSIDAKRRRAFGEQWTQFAGVTSNIPLRRSSRGGTAWDPRCSRLDSGDRSPRSRSTPLPSICTGKSGRPLPNVSADIAVAKPRCQRLQLEPSPLNCCCRGERPPDSYLTVPWTAQRIPS